MCGAPSQPAGAHRRSIDYIAGPESRRRAVTLTGIVSVECHVDGIVMYADIGVEAARQRGVDQILRRATQADEQVVVVGIDDRG